MSGVKSQDLLIGEWACLGIICETPIHRFGVAARLKQAGDIGRIWTMSRALTYRSIEQLALRGLVEAAHEEPGVAGGTRTIYRATRLGRNALREWLDTPVNHLREFRSELLLKIELARLLKIDTSALLELQREVVHQSLQHFPSEVDSSGDVVSIWRNEMATAALRFLDQL
jgi:DNA-binding PadR family transcriptional regulator